MNRVISTPPPPPYVYLKDKRSGGGEMSVESYIRQTASWYALQATVLLEYSSRSQEVQHSHATHFKTENSILIAKELNKS
jgi:hypothetical protein